jgi:ABC-type nickel/cobalt efflux system permease component RcnA
MARETVHKVWRLAFLAIFMPLILMMIVGCIWDIIDILCQTAEISMNQFNRPIVIGVGAYLISKSCMENWLALAAMRKKSAKIGG